MYVGIGAVAIAVAVGITYIIEFVMPRFSNSAENVAIHYIESINNKDFNGLCECLFPDYAESVKEYADSVGGGEAFLNQAYDSMFTSNDKIDFGDHVSISISNTSQQEQTFENGLYNGHDLSALDVKAVTTVTADITTRGSKNEVTEKVSFVCVKIKNNWYIYSMASVEEQPDTGWSGIDASSTVAVSHVLN